MKIATQLAANYPSRQYRSLRIDDEITVNFLQVIIKCFDW